jgi:hypothetical protein
LESAINFALYYELVIRPGHEFDAQHQRRIVNVIDSLGFQRLQKIGTELCVLGHVLAELFDDSPHLV